MKNLTTSTAFILFTLFSQPGLTADLATTVLREATQVSVASTEPRRAIPAQGPAIQFAAVSEARVLDARILNTGALRDAGQAPDMATAGGLPSTPIALASLLLLLCILIGRRNA